jgi:hypothetical protein
MDIKGCNGVIKMAEFGGTKNRAVTTGLRQTQAKAICARGTPRSAATAATAARIFESTAVGCDVARIQIVGKFGDCLRSRIGEVKPSAIQ